MPVDKCHESYYLINVFNNFKIKNMNPFPRAFKAELMIG